MAWICGLAAITFAAPAAAQVVEPQVGPSRFHLGGGFIIAQPVGEFADGIDVGFGFGGHGLYDLDPAGAVSLRADAGFIIYGSETQRVCLSTTVGCRIEVDLTTTNNIGYLHVGPQLMLPYGPVRPYVNAGIGIGYFGTQSSVEGTSTDDDFASTTNFDDATFAWAAGGGFYIPLSIRNTSISIDLGARYNGNGNVQYLREGDIQDNPDGSISFTPRDSEANLITYSIGVSIGLRRGR
ncbi:MAG: outer membrane beta-barrel protein [Longimicrobiales bacterium]